MGHLRSDVLIGYTNKKYEGRGKKVVIRRRPRKSTPRIRLVNTITRMLNEEKLPRHRKHK